MMVDVRLTPPELAPGSRIVFPTSVLLNGVEDAVVSVQDAAL